LILSVCVDHSFLPAGEIGTFLLLDAAAFIHKSDFSESPGSMVVRDTLVSVRAVSP
jgi:hypothetical protein